MWMYVRCTLKVHKKQFSHPVYIQRKRKKKNCKRKTSSRIFPSFCCCCIFCWLFLLLFFFWEKKQQKREWERCEFFFFFFFLYFFMLQPRIEVRSVKWVELNRLFNRKSFLHCCWRLFSCYFSCSWFSLFSKNMTMYIMCYVCEMYVRRRDVL